MSSQPFISIIIAALNEERVIRSCLESIFKMDYPRELMEVLVVDGLSTDATREIAKEFDVRIITNDKRALVDGYNKGFEEAKGELLAFCDADCIVSKTWLSNATKYFFKPEIGAIGGPMATPKEGIFSAAVGLFFEIAAQSGFSFHAQKITNTSYRTTHIPSCNLICTKKAYASIYPIVWKEPAGVDLEMSRRMLQEGYELWMTTDVSLWHRKKTNIRSFWKEMYGYGKGRAVMMMQYGEYGKFQHAVVGFLIPLSIVASLIAWLTGLLSWLAYCTFTAVALYGLFIFYKSTSVYVAIAGMVTLIVGPLAWSAGFLSKIHSFRNSFLVSTLWKTSKKL